jgi:hypothetical protein
LENINRLFSELDALFSYAKSLSNKNLESVCIEERYKYLDSKINETIKKTLNDLFEKQLYIYISITHIYAVSLLELKFSLYDLYEIEFRKLTIP